MDASPQDNEYLKSLTVLYVEDDAESMEQLSEFLSRVVGVLITATNGSEGFSAYNKHHPDIIITDIRMPVMDGLTMLQNIRGLARGKLVPALVLTAFEQEAVVKHNCNVGMYTYIVKPVDGFILYESLLECSHRLQANNKRLRQASSKRLIAKTSRLNYARKH